MTRPRLTALHALAAIATVGLSLLALAIADQLAAPSQVAFDLRPAILCVSLLGFTTLSYLVWPSRWNVLAHTQLVFSVVAYVIPIAFLDVLDPLAPAALDTYYRVAAVGLCCAVVGTLAGAAMVGRGVTTRVASRFSAGAGENPDLLRRRVAILVWLSIAGIAFSFAVMGFVPALDPNPLTAKFFRGAYAAPYAPVAPIYRAATSVIAVLMPLVAFYAFARREIVWKLALVGCLAVMLAGLQREPAVTGFLVLLGVVLAARRGGMPLYFALLASAYFIGGALYSILGALGFGGFTASEGPVTGFLAQVSGGAPDIRDQVSFMQAWMVNSPPLTLGRTFLGGLIPGNFPWNPSVWSLQVLNPGVPIEKIASGGLRLPPPVWGLASFGWPGLVAVSFTFGLLTGVLTKLASRIIPAATVFQSLMWTVLYIAAMEVLPNFFRLSYLSVGQLVLVVFLASSTRPLLAGRKRAEVRIPRTSPAPRETSVAG